MSVDWTEKTFKTIECIAVFTSFHLMAMGMFTTEKTPQLYQDIVLYCMMSIITLFESILKYLLIFELNVYLE